MSLILCSSPVINNLGAGEQNVYHSRPTALNKPARPNGTTTDRLNSSSQLLVTLLAAGGIIFLATLLLPESIAPSWIRFAQPAFLLTASLLALVNARSYRSELRNAFALLSVFLLLYGLLNIESVNDWAFDTLEQRYFRWLFIYQVIAYAFLLGSCFFVLRAVAFDRMTRITWTSLALAAALGIAIIWNALPTYDTLTPINRDAANIYLVIRIFDSLVATSLVPVIAIYFESVRKSRNESASFISALAGVIVGLVVVYIYELVSGDSLLDIAANDAVTGSFLDAIYVLGYWTIGAGLVAHWLNHRLAFADLDRILEPA